MALWLRACAALPEKPGFTSSPSKAAHNHLYLLSRRSNAFWPLQHQACIWYKDVRAYLNTHIHKQTKTATKILTRPLSKGFPLVIGSAFGQVLTWINFSPSQPLFWACLLLNLFNRTIRPFLPSLYGSILYLFHLNICSSHVWCLHQAPWDDQV